MQRTFRSFRVRGFRIFYAGSFVAAIGTWMGRIAQDWLVLTELTDHSSRALGVVTGLQFLPFLLLAPWAGAIADRFPKRRILLVTQSSLLATGLVLGGLVVTGVATLWQVYVIALAQGVVTAVDNPARQAIVSELVPAEVLANAVALNSAAFHAARLVGPGTAGLLIAALGTGWTLVAGSVTFAFLILALALLRRDEFTTAPPVRGRGAIRHGLRYVRERPDLIVVMLLIFVLGTFGMNLQMTSALMATQEFGKGPAEFGVLGSVVAVGALAGALLSARRSRPRLRVLVIALVSYTVFTTVATLAPNYALFAVSLVPIGLSTLTALTTANAMVQLGSEPAMRGRVMALYMALYMGGNPLGAPFVGWVGDVLGARWALAVGPVAVGLAVVSVGAWLARMPARAERCRHTSPPAVRPGVR